MAKLVATVVAKRVGFVVLSVIWLVPLWVTGDYFFKYLNWVDSLEVSSKALQATDYPFMVSMPAFLICLYWFRWTVVAFGLTVGFRAWVVSGRLYRDRPQQMGE